MALVSTCGSRRDGEHALRALWCAALQQRDDADDVRLHGPAFVRAERAGLLRIALLRPACGAVTSGDSVLPGDGYDPWSLSRYAYVQGNPENRTDPTGHINVMLGDDSGGATVMLTTTSSATSAPPTTPAMESATFRMSVPMESR